MRIKDAANLVGQYVVLNDSEDAQVYKVALKHPSMPLYAVSYGERRGTSYWIDVSAIALATPVQIDRYLAEFA